MVLSSMQLQKVSVTLWFRRLHCLVLRGVLSVFIDMRSAESVCSYYGPRVCSQTNKLKFEEISKGYIASFPGFPIRQSSLMHVLCSPIAY